ncbi:unnamed protein product [Clonostachys rhizophaga]|uniref:Uncharacterized protein n=1 Tax=Clonostachys rhizophaga TaxID=160324 RepID=A0A9N9YF82_9HYPO|nr:unnamed protein product [Clonostachys rhizophaga]
MSHFPAPPPVPPPPAFNQLHIRLPKPPPVPQSGPDGAYLIELAVYNGYPFKDHWAYFVRSHTDPEIGVKIHATGDVRNGFQLESKRSHDLRDTVDIPSKRIPLQWVDGKYFDSRKMFNGGVPVIESKPVCGFEDSVYKIPAPRKSMNTIDDVVQPGKAIIQRDCQTWIVESADQLVADGIFAAHVAAYLHALKQ